MATRSYFYIEDNFIKKENADFEWFPGFTVVQKQRFIDSLHSQIRKNNKNPLEISTKSKSPLGQKLSAFNLKLADIFLNNIFQSSKVFENGDPYLDLLNIFPQDAKNDQRLKEFGQLIAFRYHSVDASQMTETEIHAKIMKGYDLYKKGRTHDAAVAFSKFRENNFYI